MIAEIDHPESYFLILIIGEFYLSFILILNNWMILSQFVCRRGKHLSSDMLKYQCCFRSQSISNPNVRNFGRSLLAGYCPSYMPDLVLHGTSSDEKLRQCLVADLLHTVHVSDPSWGPSGY